MILFYLNFNYKKSEKKRKVIFEGNIYSSSYSVCPVSVVYSSLSE